MHPNKSEQFKVGSKRPPKNKCQIGVIIHDKYDIAQLFVDCLLEVKILFEAHTRLVLRVLLVLRLVWIIAAENRNERIQNKCSMSCFRSHNI